MLNQTQTVHLTERNERENEDMAIWLSLLYDDCIMRGHVAKAF